LSDRKSLCFTYVLNDSESYQPLNEITQRSVLLFFGSSSRRRKFYYHLPSVQSRFPPYNNIYYIFDSIMWRCRRFCCHPFFSFIKAVCRSVFLTIRHCILTVELTKNVLL